MADKSNDGTPFFDFLEFGSSDIREGVDKHQNRVPRVLEASMAKDSVPKRCLVNQGFSRKMQEYLVVYALRVSDPRNGTIE